VVTQRYGQVPGTHLFEASRRSCARVWGVCVCNTARKKEKKKKVHQQRTDDLGCTIGRESLMNVVAQSLSNRDRDVCWVGYRLSATLRSARWGDYLKEEETRSMTIGLHPSRGPFSPWASFLQVFTLLLPFKRQSRALIGTGA
jgi:hypothetical protein